MVTKDDVSKRCSKDGIILGQSDIQYELMFADMTCLWYGVLIWCTYQGQNSESWLGKNFECKYSTYL